MEYFNPDFMIPLQRRWTGHKINSFVAAEANLITYGKFLAEKRSRGQIFSAKLFPGHLSMYNKAFSHFQKPRNYVYLTRRDKVSQTISFAATLLTRRAFNDDYELKYIHKIAHINEEKISKIFLWLKKEEQFWSDFFRTVTTSRVLHFEWENVKENPEQSLGLVAKKFGLPLSDIQTSPFNIPYQKDLELKSELAARFGSVLVNLEN